jgi:hypothetical protein
MLFEMLLGIRKKKDGREGAGFRTCGSRNKSLVTSGEEGKV